MSRPGVSAVPGAVKGAASEERGPLSPDGAKPGAPRGTAWLEKEPAEEGRAERQRERQAKGLKLKLPLHTSGLSANTFFSLSQFELSFCHL